VSDERATAFSHQPSAFSRPFSGFSSRLPVAQPDKEFAMSTFKKNAFVSDCGEAPGEAEATLRLIARLPAPAGLEERVKAGLRTARLSAAPARVSSRARILSFPTRSRLESNWMRSAAAAAIVFVVVGGGWGVYSRVQPAQPARVTVLPPRVATPGGFSSAGAMRTPQTLNGPVVTHKAAVVPLAAKDSAKAAPAHKTMRGSKGALASKAATEPAVAPTK
jgi:hypothetical protein